MRKLLPSLLLSLTATLALAQGRISFENDSLHLVYMTTDAARLLPADIGLAGQPVPALGQLPSGHSLLVDLWGGTSSSSLAKLTTTTFSLNPGLFGPVNVVLPGGFPGGAPDYFQVQVYDAAAGSYEAALQGILMYSGESSIFTVTPNSGLAYTSILTGWAPGPVPIPGSGAGSIVVQLSPIPEPSLLALAALGVGLCLRRRAG